jgi:hypothetical protein
LTAVRTVRAWFKDKRLIGRSADGKRTLIALLCGSSQLARKAPRGGTVAQRQASVVPFEAPKHRLVRGTRLVEVPKHSDERGFLIALDRNQSLPFDVRRVYCIYPGVGGAVRGEHATSAHCALVALQGSVEVDLDNGDERGSVHLSRTDQALCIHAGVWLRVRDLSPDGIILVAASRLFGESVYYRRPSRGLLEGLAHERWR